MKYYLIYMLYGEEQVLFSCIEQASQFNNFYSLIPTISQMLNIPFRPTWGSLSHCYLNLAFNIPVIS
jgi:hypothetical protein